MEKMKFVLVGCGRIASLHVAGYRDREDAVLWGVYDKNPQTAKRFAADHGVSNVYDSFEAVLADPDVTGVELLVPHHLHCEMTVAACRAKKHVSVQKPMALCLSECDEMIQAAKDNGVVLKVFENFVHYPPYLLLKQMIEQGEIGTVQGVRYKLCNASLFSDNTPGAEARAKRAGVKKSDACNTTGWKVEPTSWLWRLNDSLCGGGPAVFDDGYHKFSLFIDLVGSVEKVSAWIDETPVMPGIMQDMPAVVMWKYAGKKVYGVWDITSAPDLYVKGKYYTCDERLEVTGTRGVLWLTRCTAEMLEDVAPVVMYRDGEMTQYWDVPHDWQDAFIHSTHDFIESIRDGREPLLSGERGKEVLAFALAALASSDQKKEVYIEELADRNVGRRRGILSIFGRKHSK